MRRRISNHKLIVHTQLYSRLTELLLTVACIVLPFYIRTTSVWQRFLNWNVWDFAFSRILLWLSCCLYGAFYIWTLASCLYNLFHTHDFYSCSFCLQFSFEMILGRFHLRNNIICSEDGSQITQKKNKRIKRKLLNGNTFPFVYILLYETNKKYDLIPVHILTHIHLPTWIWISSYCFLFPSNIFTLTQGNDFHFDRKKEKPQCH